jgi:hypothetical protein
VHLDGYDQTDLITGKGPSKRNEIFYFTEGTLSAVRVGDYKYRFTDQPNGWFATPELKHIPVVVCDRLGQASALVGVKSQVGDNRPVNFLGCADAVSQLPN